MLQLRCWFGLYTVYFFGCRTPSLGPLDVLDTAWDVLWVEGDKARAAATIAPRPADVERGLLPLAVATGEYTSSHHQAVYIHTGYMVSWYTVRCVS